MAAVPAKLRHDPVQAGCDCWGLVVVEGAGDLGELAEDRFSPQAAAVLVVPLAERPRGGLQFFDFPHPESARAALPWDGGGRNEPAFEAVEEGSAGYRGSRRGRG